MKHKMICIILALIVLGVIGTTISGGENQPAKGGQSKSTSTAKTFKIGDVIQLKNSKFEVNKIRTGNGISGMEPPTGKEYFYVDCTIQNISTEEQTVSSILMFKVQDSDGRSYDLATPGDQNGHLDGKIGVGKKISGEYVVEAPKSKTGLQLVFDSSVFSTGSQLIVDLN